MNPELALLVRESLHGVAEIEFGSHGLKFSRLAKKFAVFHDHDQLTEKVAAQGSGSRIALMTSASEVTLTYRSTRDMTKDLSFIGKPSVVTLTCGEYSESIHHDNGDLRVWNGAELVEITVGDNSQATFKIPHLHEAGEIVDQLIEIWLPHNCNIEIVDLFADAPLRPAVITSPRWVHYGSSISHCVEADEPTGVWPVAVARELNLDLFNLGLAGSANLELFAAHAIRELQPAIVTLKVGINIVNGRHLTRRTFIPAVHSFLDNIREYHPKIPIVVVSPIICPGHESLPGPTRVDLNGKVIGSEPCDLEWVEDLTLVEIRQILLQVINRRDDDNLFYLDGLELFGLDDIELLPDGLHPNSEGYRIIGQRFMHLLSPLVDSMNL